MPKKVVVESRLVLGAAQFGFTYGVANTRGKPADRQVASILGAASAAGIKRIDTASAYGESEAVLGRVGVNDWQVTTKLPPMGECDTSELSECVDKFVQQSLAQLGVERLHGLLVHDARDLVGPRGALIASAMRRCRDKGSVSMIGVSIYRPSDLDSLGRDFIPDVVQAPLNVFDQRMLAPSMTQKLADWDCELHARSVFLQGLLLMPRELRPSYFNRWKEHFDRYDSLVEAFGGDPLSVCLGFVADLPLVNRIIVGVETEAQLSDILNSLDQKDPRSNLGELSIDDTDLIEPRFWQV